MVRPTGIVYGTMRTFGRTMKTRDRYTTSRYHLKHQKFQSDINPEEIVAFYSKEDYYKYDRRADERSYLEAKKSLGRKTFILPNLNAQDLEVNNIFQEELNRQRAIVARVDKIRVLVDSRPGQGRELMMNKDISTPFDCAQHIHDLVTTRTVVAELEPLCSDVAKVHDEDAEVDAALGITDKKGDEGKAVAKIEKPIYWDMHRPLESSCRVKFRHFAEPEVGEVNKIYWRSCSFILGMAVKMAFKDEIKVLLHSWPKPDIKSGSFVYDVALNLSDTWKPAEQELRAFTKIMWEIKNSSIPFERLTVDRETARKLFNNNPFKLTQIDSILENESSQGRVTVYRCGGLVDISIGPMISNTSQIGRITLTSVHPFDTEVNDFKGLFYRFQGVSLPQQLPISSFLYQNVLINKAKKLNTSSL